MKEIKENTDMNKNRSGDSAKKINVGAILGKYGVYIALLVLFIAMSVRCV